ncbi:MULTISPECIES: hypothetical protein [Gammaproteobacteria]|uniref:hypothetical protein n=1 Tax=Gammaproteobacteria TaxID=1236 RepID=UPI002FC89F15
MTELEYKKSKFRCMIADQLRAEGYKGDALEFSSCLDMSFDEICDKPESEWASVIKGDCEDYKIDCPEEFY